MDRATVAGLRDQRAATLVQLAGLGGDDWRKICLPPWRVREVVAHLATTDEGVVTGRILPALLRGDRRDVERWNDAAVLRLAAVEPAELPERLERWGARLAALAGRVPPGVDRLRLRTAHGRLPLHLLLCRRVVDEWVHGADIAAATGVVAPLAPTVPDVLARGVLATFPAVVLPRTSRRAGVLRLVVGTGSGTPAQPTRRTWGLDFPRRQYGPRVAARADATVHVHATTLALLAERRLHWRRAPPGSVVVDGDADVAAGLLDPLCEEAA